jgi:hypothetical protein
MMKKIMASLLLITPMFAGLTASTVESPTASKSSSHHDESHRPCRNGKDGTNGTNGTDGKDGRPGRDGRDGRDAGVLGFSPEIAYFYRTPSDYASLDFLFIDDQDSVIWDSERFTIKSDGINVLQSLSIDPNDSLPFNFLTVNDDIVFDSSGIYLITYTIYANLADSDQDWYSFELRINDFPVAGSRFTATISIVDDEEDTDAQELVGQVITYIPANAHLELTNVSGTGIVLQNDVNNGNTVSIAIQKIADSVN